MEASPGNFFSSKFSRELTGSFWRKNTEAQKSLGNPRKTVTFEVISVKLEFWLKDLTEIPPRICTQINKRMTIRIYLDSYGLLSSVKNEKL